MFSRTRRMLPTAGLLLGVAMGLANVMGYVFVALVSATLGPADFGGYSALNTYGILLAMPAGAFQVIVARRQTRTHRDQHRHVTGLGTSLVVGVVLAAITIALAPLLRDLLRLETASSVVWLALMLPPMTVTGALQGVLLGREAYARLSLVYLVTAGTRLAAAGVAVGWRFDVAEVFAATFVASVATIGAALALARRDLGAGTRAPRILELLDDLVRSNVALAGLMALSSLDVVLARTVLTDHDSGSYALAALFGKVVFWGTQFVALAIVPALADSRTGGQVRTTLHRSALGVLLIGSAVSIGCALFPGPLVALSGGSAFVDAEPLLVWAAVVGTLWAIVQVWLFAGMSRGDHVMTVVVWFAAGVQAVLVLVAFNSSPYEIFATVGTTAGVVALIGLARVPRGGMTPAPDSAETAEALGMTRE
ncbi:oligosaccharide flippase family protein [Janibacter cremeus]|uniref:O-antigen/teichoic acid export membrane protein n=1 Tax=Janibacter cremeus TaxID=1285192 RepID=A0A852VUD6_9MICO|nr:oligosaccharide flippase family protein [Janibacter cremeus]NYF99599.1 O-antigen/teichoic acid export membrane protein [Janibacter cremeus]